MREVQVNPGRQTALAQGGATWGEFDREGERFGLATTGGVISSTGVCGLTAGWRHRLAHGQARPQLRQRRLRRPRERRRQSPFVSATQNEDLFWAIRGGGGNFGIVTALEFRLHQLANIHGGIVLYPRPVAFDLLRQYRDLTSHARPMSSPPMPRFSPATVIPWRPSHFVTADRRRPRRCVQAVLPRLAARRRYDRRKEIH